MTVTPSTDLLSNDRSRQPSLSKPVGNIKQNLLVCIDLIPSNTLRPHKTGYSIILVRRESLFKGGRKILFEDGYLMPIEGEPHKGEALIPIKVIEVKRSLGSKSRRAIVSCAEVGRTDSIR